MGTVNQILELANKQIGNTGEKYWNWYTDNIRPGQGYYIDGYKTPYCAEYQSWLLAMTNTDCIYFPDPFAFDERDIHPADRISKYNLKPGDIISYDFDNPKDDGGDHVGIVIDTFYWGVRANEGNVSGIVDIRDRYWSEILFGIRPEYDGAEEPLIVDGVFGEKTVTKLQECLNKHGFYLNYLIDGDFGFYTKRELQKYLQSVGYYEGYYLDGDFGYYSTCALQEYLAELDYYDGEIDGWWYTMTTEALQMALNDDVF